MTLKRILVAIDFHHASACALDFARALADATGASLELLHVAPYPVSIAQTLDEAERDACVRLERLLDADDRARRHATVACVIGTPAREIVDYAAGHGVDLIVMGTHAHGPTCSMATGSIAESVLGFAPCAVLAVKEAPRVPGVTLDASLASAHA